MLQCFNVVCFAAGWASRLKTFCSNILQRLFTGDFGRILPDWMWLHKRGKIKQQPNVVIVNSTNDFAVETTATLVYWSTLQNGQPRLVSTKCQAVADDVPL